MKLIGAASEDMLRGSPLDCYPTGILFPITQDQEGVDPASESEDDDEADSLGEDTSAGKAAFSEARG
ncbi:hypothetical protein AGMMS49545_15230 [Betaproteobacteria bacterium]|nr:hypothetical protein AGMMS49545_15140 [Betaproteobacteria bacterium]GHT94242.1 hypothetical protein AGMMS49545_15230 [Betaproteobacteria bacterium]GHU48351.1 hypothetical protein AGMMS50289_24860 [Betaproteobacteria bacterium]